MKFLPVPLYLYYTNGVFKIHRANSDNSETVVVESNGTDI